MITPHRSATTISYVFFCLKHLALQEEALELSRRADEDRQRKIEELRRDDEESLKLAIELSKANEKDDDDDDDDLKKALDLSRRDSERLDDLDEEEDRHLEEAMRLSRLDAERPPRIPRVRPPLPRVVTHLSQQVQMMGGHQPNDYAVAAIPIEHREDDDYQLTLNFSEQVESIERVLDADTDAEQLQYALEASKDECKY